jgi:hypothetical protein
MKSPTNDLYALVTCIQFAAALDNELSQDWLGVGVESKPDKSVAP